MRPRTMYYVGVDKKDPSDISLFRKFVINRSPLVARDRTVFSIYRRMRLVQRIAPVKVIKL